ncbi:MAG TPA: hypothetical protein VHP11_14370 [Tepidisphaeraceae bacterium]|nr:hypothetical protein [Tepidisphaeraceae bacterium]
MKRWAFSIASAVSLVLLCVAISVLWVRSYWAMDYFQWLQWTNGNRQQLGRAWTVWSGRGIIGLCSSHYTAQPPLNQPWHFLWESSDAATWKRPAGSLSKYLGFGYARVDDPRQGYSEVYVPHWLLIAMFSVLPASWFMRTRRDRLRRIRLGLCRVCGYDLRANRERCPECGKPISTSGVKATS